MSLALATCFFTNAAFGSDNRPASTDSTTTPATGTIDPSSAPPNLKEITASAAPEPDHPQSPETKQIAGEQAATPRRIHYRVTLSVREVYDDNINISQIDRKKDFYTTIEPSINVGLGDDLHGEGNYLNLDYAPSAFLFINHSENDTLQHVIALTGQYRFPLLTLNLTQGVQILDGAGLASPTGTGIDFTRTNLDVSARTRLNIYSTRLDANYELTGKTFLTGSLSYNVADYATLISSSVVAANLYINYTCIPKLAIGLGLAGGYNSVEAPSQSQTFEQLNARASYELTSKVSAVVSAGVEFRQILDSSSGEGAAPIFDGSLFYQPFDGTTLVLSSSRRTQNSATLAGEDFHSTSVVLSARQRFLQRFYVGISGGYENSSYFSTLSGLVSTRTDNYYFLQGSLDLDITRFGSAEIYYFYRENGSTIDSFSFYDNQFGLRTFFTF
jgi:hypothetical protein